jgi:hypothetical protein
LFLDNLFLDNAAPQAQFDPLLRSISVLRTAYTLDNRKKAALFPLAFGQERSITFGCVLESVEVLGRPSEKCVFG